MAKCLEQPAFPLAASMRLRAIMKDSGVNTFPFFGSFLPSCALWVAGLYVSVIHIRADRFRMNVF